MKVKNFLVWVLLLICTVSCKYDDGEIWDKVNSLDDRLTAIEGQLNQLNSDIESVSTIANAVQNNVFVSKVEETSEGYRISFTDGKSITVGKGGSADASTPIIGVDEENGVYYWTQTVNGNTSWLTDATGNKIPVSGAQAVTPRLKVSADGFWMVSYDNGVNFEQMLDENGNPVKAVGEDGEDGADGVSGGSGESWFDNVYYDEANGTLVLVYGGQEFELQVVPDTGVPSDEMAEKAPEIKGEQNVNIPNFSTFIEDGSNGRVMRMSLTGIQLPNNEWMELYGTGDTRQNVWLEIDGEPKGIAVINGTETQTRAFNISKAQADVVFLVDNSGSMSEEANAVANEILSWSQTLAGTMDVQFGCVGIDHRYINGAIDITSVENLSDYLNRDGLSGTARTRGYVDTQLETSAQTYNNAGGECGGIMLHFADQHFNFRPGANRIYIYFTDEPNQPGGNEEWSVLTVNPESSYYVWNTSKGTIHTVFSDMNNYLPDSYNWVDFVNEDPRLFATYTGGTLIETTGDFNITLDELPVTGAITNSYIIRFNVTPDLLSGTHTVKITIYDEKGNIQAERTWENVSFSAS